MEPNTSAEDSSSNPQLQPPTTDVGLVAEQHAVTAGPHHPSPVVSEMPTQDNVLPGTQMGIPAAHQHLSNDHGGNLLVANTQNPPYILYSNLGPLMAPLGLQFFNSSASYAPPNEVPISYQYPGIPPANNMVLLGPLYLAHHMQTTNTLGNWILPNHGIGPQGHQQPHSTLTDILSQPPADARPQPKRRAQKQTRLQTLRQVNHDDPLPREAFLMVTTVKKLNDREAEFCRKPDGKAEVDRDGRWIRKFDSLPMHLRHDMLNSRLLVRAELEGANAMRDIIIARTEYVSERYNLQVQAWKSSK